MKKFIKFTLSVLLVSLSLILFATDIQKVEPPFWWTGMQHTELQILIYGENIGDSEPSLRYEGVTLEEIIRVENPNYLFLYLRIDKSASPGMINVNFQNDGGESISLDYELKERKEGSAERAGFDNSDVLYLLMPDRFANGNPNNDSSPQMREQADRANRDGRHGGDIQGIDNHLEYLKELGITGLWINPLVENNNPAYSYHGYAITDFYNIDARYGTNEEYLALIDHCHDKDLKMVMDMVFNHCSKYHWFIEDLPMSDWIHQHDEFTKSNFRASTLMDIHSSEYDRTKLLTGWFDHHMADLDQRNELLALYLIQNSVWWIEYANLDGIRIDTQPYSYKEFITQWSDYVFTEYPNFNVVGEAWLQKEAFVSYFQKDALNRDGYNSGIPSVTDFPMYYAMSKAFAEEDSWTKGMARIYYVLAQDMLYADASKNLIFCDNHDVDRIYSSMGENFDNWKMAFGALLTLRGVPMIYYGTELLMTGLEHDGHGFIRQDIIGGWAEDNRNAFTEQGRTVEENAAFNYLQTLLQWRKSKEVIFNGKLTQFIPSENVYVYFRHNESDCVMIAFNNSKNELKALETERFQECIQNYSFGINVVTGEAVRYLDAITIPPKTVLILDLKN